MMTWKRSRVKTEEYDTMSTALDGKKKMIGDNAANIATESSEVETMQGQVAAPTQLRP